MLYDGVILKNIRQLRRSLLQNPDMNEVEHKASVMKLQFMHDFLKEAYRIAGWHSMEDAFDKEFE